MANDPEPETSYTREQVDAIRAEHAAEIEALRPKTAEHDGGWKGSDAQKAWRERRTASAVRPSTGIHETFAIDCLTIAAESDLSDDALRGLVSTIAMLAHGSFAEPLPLDRELAARRWVELVARSLPGFRAPPRTTAAKSDTRVAFLGVRKRAPQTSRRDRRRY